MKMRGAVAFVLAMTAALASGAAAQDALRDATLAVPAVSLSFSLQYLADDLHLWEKHGLRMKSVLIPGVGSANAVISGSADAGDASPPALTRAAAHGQKMLAIGALQNRLFLDLVMRKAAVPGFDSKAPLAARVAVLRGKTIAVDSINSIIHAYVLLLAHRGGVSANDIRIAPMQPNAMLAAFETGQIDGFAMSLPWPEEPVLNGTGVIIASGLAGDPPDMVPFAQALVVVKPETCATRAWLCEGVGATLKDAAAFVHQHPDQALALLQKHFATLDPRLVAASFREMVRITPSPPVPGIAELKNAERLNIEAGLLKPAEQLTDYDGLATGKYAR